MVQLSSSLRRLLQDVAALLTLVLVAGCAGEMELPPHDGQASGDGMTPDGRVKDAKPPGEVVPAPKDLRPDLENAADGPAMAYGPDLILNGGFEAGASSQYSGVGKQWECNDAKSHPANHSLSTAQKHGGKASQKIDTKGSWDHYPIRQVTPYGSVKPGRTYRLRAWVRSQGNTNPNSWYVLGIWWFQNEAKVGEQLNNKQPATSYDWRLLTIEAKAPAKANRLAVFLSAHYHGIVWYDDIEVRERLSPP